jgi:hypothetical protein
MMFEIVVTALIAGGVAYHLGRLSTKAPDEDEMMRLLVMCDAARRIKGISRERLEARIRGFADEVVTEATGDLGPSEADVRSEPVA